MILIIGYDYIKSYINVSIIEERKNCPNLVTNLRLKKLYKRSYIFISLMKQYSLYLQNVTF